MLLSPVFAVAFSILGDVPDARADRLAALGADPAVACYEVAPGRKSTPVRENFLTFSDVVAVIPRGKAVFGVRVAGENKVQIVVPDAATEIGIARHTFLKEVGKERCEGERLFAPSFDSLLGWGEPLPGVAGSPKVDKGEGLMLHQGCYAATGDVSFKAVDGEKVKVAKGDVFFGGDALDDGRVSPKLKVLDPTSGDVRGLIGRTKLERVPLSKCAALK